jgi:hypothetical protein
MIKLGYFYAEIQAKINPNIPISQELVISICIFFFPWDAIVNIVFKILGGSPWNFKTFLSCEWYRMKFI